MANNLSILSKSNWEQFYPAEEYRSYDAYVKNGNKLPAGSSTESTEMLKTIIRVKSHLLHFCLGLDEPLDVTLSTIQAIAQKFKETKDVTLLKPLMKVDEQNHSLTPLHIAVMKGKKEVVFALLEVFASQAPREVRDVIRGAMNAPDARKWTPLHHAALLSPIDEKLSKEIIEKLKASGANIECVNNLNATYEHIERLVIKGSNLAPFKTIQLEGKPLTRTNIQERLPDIEFRNDHYFAPEYRQNLWLQEPTEIDDVFEDSLIKNSLKLAPRKFNIVEVVHRGQAIPGFYGLSAGETLPAGALIGHYSGSFVPELILGGFQARFAPDTLRDSSYLFIFDGQKVRNHTAMSNHGFPNSMVYSTDQNGVANIPYYFVAEKIEMGKAIYIDYGPDHPINFLPQILLNVEAMEQFFRPGLDAIWESMRPLELETNHHRELPLTQRQKLNMVDGSAYISKMVTKTRIVYVLSNPRAMLYLHFSNILPLSVWKEVVNWNNKPSDKPYAALVDRWCNARPQHYFNLVRMVAWLTKLDQEIKTIKPNDYPFFQKWVLDHLESLSMMDLTKAIEWLGTDLLNEARTTSNEELVISIQDRLKAYDWKQDQMNFYGLEARRLAYDEYYTYKAQSKLALIQNIEILEDPQALKKMKVSIMKSVLAKMEADDLADESSQILVGMLNNLRVEIARLNLQVHSFK